jgi:hypothetical protein
MHPERDVREIARELQGMMPSSVERDIDDASQFISGGTFEAQRCKSVVVGRVSAAARPQGKEQHPRHALLCWWQLLVGDGVVVENSTVTNSSRPIVDMSEGANPFE